MRLLLLLLVPSLITAPPAFVTEETCLHSHDRDLCDSTACKGFRWCDICDKCLRQKDAVYKDEL